VSLISVWTSHLPADKRPAFEQEIRNSHRVLSRLQSILQERYQDVLKDEDKLSSLEPGIIGFHRGRRSEIRDLLRLLDFLDR
jgi:hypothetical protein